MQGAGAAVPLSGAAAGALRPARSDWRARIGMLGLARSDWRAQAGTRPPDRWARVRQMRAEITAMFSRFHAIPFRNAT